nr:MAG TPA: hypothetical protein [Caudoviricetes sp.]
MTSQQTPKIKHTFDKKIRKKTKQNTHKTNVEKIPPTQKPVPPGTIANERRKED